MYEGISARLIFSEEDESVAVFATFSFGIGRVVFKWQPSRGNGESAFWRDGVADLSLVTS